MSRARGHVALKGKRWYVVVDLPRDPLNPKKRNQKWFPTDARTPQEAEIARTRVLREIDTGQNLDPTKMTVGEHCQSWYDAIQHRLRPGSRTIYRRVIRLYVAPTIGTIPLARLTPALVATWLQRLRAGGRKESTLNVYFWVLHAALDNAVTMELIPRNPASRVEKPSREKEERPSWDGDQARRFLDLIKGDRYEAVYIAAIGTGLRKGELLGLTWKDIDLARRALTVRQAQVQEVGVGPLISRTKTRHGRRVVTLPSFVVEALGVHRERQEIARREAGAQWEETGLVFCKPNGALLPAASFDYHWEKLRGRLVAEENLPYIHFHDLRHLHATLGLEMGVDVKTLSERLGHHSAGFTLDTYGHVTKKMRDTAARKYDEFFGSQEPAAD